MGRAPGPQSHRPIRCWWPQPEHERPRSPRSRRLAVGAGCGHSDRQRRQRPVMVGGTLGCQDQAFQHLGPLGLIADRLCQRGNGPERRVARRQQQAPAAAPPVSDDSPGPSVGSDAASTSPAPPPAPSTPASSPERPRGQRCHRGRHRRGTPGPATASSGSSGGRGCPGSTTASAVAGSAPVVGERLLRWSDQLGGRSICAETRLTSSHVSAPSPPSSRSVGSTSNIRPRSPPPSQAASPRAMRRRCCPAQQVQVAAPRCQTTVATQRRPRIGPDSATEKHQQFRNASSSAPSQINASAAAVTTSNEPILRTAGGSPRS